MAYINNLPSVFDICTPRKDIQDGLVESELAADLTRVIEGEASPEYANPAKFFAGTYPTKGIKDLLHHVLTRLSGNSSSAVFWLNTSFGGGKTHALIALLHAVGSPPSDIISEFVDTALLPGEHVRIAIFDGQNADISSGHNVGDGISAHTPWGEIAYGLAGKGGYRRVDDSIQSSAPGADTIMELIGDRPTLILLDELAVYLRKAEMHSGAGKQFVAFLTSLIKAVESSPNAALVYTLAAGSDADNAYWEENRKLMGELESVSSRKATLLNPTEEGETIQILRRRLFEWRDESQVDIIVDAYRHVWKANRDRLPDVVDQPKTISGFKAGYPLHPDILDTLISKTSTLENFQRVRGMLRILGYVVHNLWKQRDELKLTAIHLHHFDLGKENMRLEITSKLKQDTFAVAIDTDIACDDVNKTSMAQRLDKTHYPHMPPFTRYITRVIFMNTLAYNPQLKGVDIRNLRYSVLWPGMEISYVDEALARFRDNSLYLDDDPRKSTQFQAAPNISQAIWRQEQSLDVSDLESKINQRIENMFQKGEFDLCKFPDGHEDVPDDTDSPKLVIPKYDNVTTSNPESRPEMIKDIFRYKGIGKGIRMYRNNLVFLVAFEDKVDAMYKAARRHLAMSKLSMPDSLAGFADYQQKIIADKKKSADVNLDESILQCYKYVYYPNQGNRLDYTTMDWKKDGGQRGLIEKLRNVQKIRTDKDEPDLPESLIDRISGLRNDGKITTLDFRNEFYRATALPMLIGEGVFEESIRLGIEHEVFIYRSGELLCGKGDPKCSIVIDENSVVYTTKKAHKLGIWPRKPQGEETIEIDGGENSIEGMSPPPQVFDLSSLSAVGKPSVAVREILDELRRHNVSEISKLQIASEDDVFPLLSLVGRIREVDATLVAEGDYELETGSSFRFDFDGTLKDAEPVLEFLKPQLRKASPGNMRISLNMDFGDSINVDWLETLAERVRLVDNDIEVSGIESTSE